MILGLGFRVLSLDSFRLEGFGRFGVLEAFCGPALLWLHCIPVQ